jgi:hypothetical protein
MRSLALLLATVALAACSTGPQPMRTAQAENHLAKLLAGRVQGQPVTCLPDYSAKDMVVVDDHTILFRDGRTYYRNDFNGGTCANLGIGSNTLVTKRFGGAGLCRGDPAEVVDLTNGFTVGNCAMGDFVPYTKPRA